MGEIPEHEAARFAAGFGTLLRTERGYHVTQQQLADRAGLDRVTIARFESGRRPPTTSTTWKIAKAPRPKDTMRTSLPWTSD